jgi:hypothetical protein
MISGVAANTCADCGPQCTAHDAADDGAASCTRRQTLLRTVHVIPGGATAQQHCNAYEADHDFAFHFLVSKAMVMT